jgi:hypothetical protein
MRLASTGTKSARHSPMLLRFNPVAALSFVAVTLVDDVLKDPTVFFNCSDRSHVIVVAGHQDAANTELLPGDLDSQRRIIVASLPAEFRKDQPSQYAPPSRSRNALSEWRIDHPTIVAATNAKTKVDAT